MVSISKSRVKARNPYSTKQQASPQVIAGVVVAVLLGCYALLSLVQSTGTSGSNSEGGSRLSRLKQVFHDHHPHLKLEAKSSPGLSDSYNAIAQDILSTLNCEELLNRTTASMTNYNKNKRYVMDDVPARDDIYNGDTKKDTNDNNSNNNNMRRRLQQVRGAPPSDDGDDSVRPPLVKGDTPQQDIVTDDGVMGGGDDWGNYYEEVTAKEVFCLAAATTSLSEEIINMTKSRFSCDASNTKQMALLDLWSSARSQMNEQLLVKTLELATESSRSIGSMHSVNLWAPRNDDGMNYILNQVSDQEENAHVNGNNFFGLSNNLGPGHLYVDVGSCLGITALAVILEYPKTQVVSVEPAAPNWLMQELNMKCNLDEDQQPTLLLAGVGPHTKETMAAKLLWRPAAVTATRAWTPAEEQVQGDDEELFVQLRPWKDILAMAKIPSSHHIDVLHMDCEGCEYNLIPSLSESEYDYIDTVMGELHWGYIPEHKLPSSKRGKLTHDRLCQHENFARTAKECCGNLETQVRSFNPGEVLYKEDKPNEVATVKDLINDGLCDDFDEWSKEHHFYDIENDYGWFEISSVAT